MQPTRFAPLPADVPETACGASARPTQHQRDAPSLQSQPTERSGASVGPQPFASSSMSSLAVAAALQYRQMKQGQAFASSSSKMPAAQGDMSPTVLAASSSVGSSSSSTSSVSSLYGRLRSTTPGLTTAGASAIAAAPAASKPRCEILSQPPLPLCSPRAATVAAAAASISSSRSSHTTPSNLGSSNRTPGSAGTTMARSSSIPHPTRTAALGAVSGFAANSSSCPTTNADPADTDMLSLLLAATHMSGAAAGTDAAGAWTNSMASMNSSAGQSVMMQQQLQHQGGLAQHGQSPASFPASMNSMQSAMMTLPGQQEAHMLNLQRQQLLLQQQVLAGTAMTAGNNGPNSSNSTTTLNHLDMPTAAVHFPADQAVMPAYLEGAAAGPAGLGGTSGDCSNDMLLLMQQQLLGQAAGGYSGNAAGPGSQQVQDMMMLDPCGFNAAGLTALQGMPMGPTDCLLPGDGSLNGSDAAGGCGSNKGDRIGAHAPHNPLYKTELCRSWLDAGTCRYGIRCQFAHGHPELRPVVKPPKYKTQPCRTFSVTGSCPYGARCNFIHDEGNVLSGLAEAVRSSVQGIGGGVRGIGAAASAMFGMSAGAAVPSNNSSWSGVNGVAGGMGSNMRRAGSAEGDSAVATALAAAGFGGVAGLGRAVSTTSHGSSSVVGAGSCSGSSGGCWPAGINVARLSNASGDSHSRDSSFGNVPGVMEHGMPAVGGVGGGCSGSLQVLLVQLPLVQGGDVYPAAFNTGM